MFRQEYGRSVAVPVRIFGDIEDPESNVSQYIQERGPAEGRLQGRLVLSGTAAAPRLSGQFQLRDVARQSKRLGNADLYVEATNEGALLHVGLNPPGGGSFLGHANLTADLGARTLAGRVYPASRPGRFLRDWTQPLAHRVRWIEVLIQNLVGLAGQMV